MRRSKKGVELGMRSVILCSVLLFLSKVRGISPFLVAFRSKEASRHTRSQEDR